MRFRNLTISPRRGRILEAMDEASIVDPEIGAPRDMAVFLLHIAAEVEHALLIQYLYTVFTAPPGANPAWTTEIRRIAIQEMGHLITIQNVLLALGAPLNLEREDYPFRRGYYPFEFSLEPFSLKTLARYTLAEMPSTGHGLTDSELAALRADAQVDTGGVSGVGLLFARLIEVIDSVDALDFLGDASFDLQAAPAEWGGSDADDPNATIVRRIRSRDEARAAMRAIAVQGEGEGLNAGSHFRKFLVIYRDFKAAPLATAEVASNPNTSGQLPAGEITAPRTRSWAHLSNLQYRLILHGLWQALHTDPTGDGAARRKVLVDGVAFRHMRVIAGLARVLTSLPLKEDGNGLKAGPPFELPYLLSLASDELGNWLTLRDILQSSHMLAGELLVAETDSARQNILKDLLRDPAREPWKTIDERISSLRPVKDLLEIRLLPPMAIARFGSSPEPMDNYDIVTPPGAGPRTLVPAETLVVDPASGAITGATTPPSLRFRDSGGRIRPVSPFIEVWARFSAGGPLVPLTLTHLETLELTPADVKWRVEAGNLKAARRTGVAADRITAAIEIAGHAPAPLVGTCANFKPGKSIPFGHVHYIRPTPEFPEIRMRFTPAPGRVYGPTGGDPNTVDDVYDSGRGTWDNFVEQPGLGSTVPGGIYAGVFNAQTNEFVSRGYLDDSCDGIVTVSMQLKSGKTLTAIARIASGPPGFAPAAIPVRTVADDLEQAIAGPDAATGTREEAADILRRALDTARLIETRVMNGNQGIGGVPQNRNNMSGHDAGFERAFEPIFPPAAAENALVVARHEGVLNSILSGAPIAVTQRLRVYDRVGDLSDAGRQQMPAMMRGADGKHLALTRRQLSIVRHYEESVVTPEPTPTGTPREAMIKLIEHLRDNENAALFHNAVATEPGGVLSDLFANPGSVLDFLAAGDSQGSFGLPAGQPLVVKGDPDASAFVGIVSGNNFMASKFRTPIASLGNRTGVEIVRAWIASLV